MRVLFLIQGEGRGHLTQALALQALLERAGHEVAAALVGISPQRELPAFFRRGLDAPLACIDSPNFSTGARGRGIRYGATVRQNTRRAGAFGRSLRAIHDAFARYRPDLVVNFFEPLAGLYYLGYHPSTPMVAVAHQFMFEHPAYVFPPGRHPDRMALRAFTALTGYGATRRLALSLYPAPDVPSRRLVVVPPLLREAVFRQERAEEPFFLVYLLNRGYADDILRWHARRPDQRLHCFWDNPTAPDVLVHDATLTFHRLDDARFLSLMARSSGLVSTAGFESVAEAMYLGKPVLMVPVEGHFEQFCNAHDAAAAGAGVAGETFDLDRLVAHRPSFRSAEAWYQPWVESAAARYLDVLEEAAYAAHARVAA